MTTQHLEEEPRKTVPEQFIEPITFFDQEKEALVSDGALIYLPERKSLQDQQEAQRPFLYIVDAEPQFLTLRARLIEVAIYPDPKKFFVPNSFERTKSEQEKLLAQDAQDLKRRLGLKSITEILPEVPEAIEVIFRNFDETGVRLLGKIYRGRFMRTNTPTSKSGFHVAHVGRCNDMCGVNIYSWPASVGDPDIGAARWVVPQRHQAIQVHPKVGGEIL